MKARWVLAGALALWVVGRASSAEVVVDTSLRHQRILGWSVNPWAPWVTDWQREQVLVLAVDELGLNRLRIGPPSGNRANQRRWEWLNDDADPLPHQLVSLPDRSSRPLPEAVGRTL